MAKIIAFVRNPLHVRLLYENEPEVDLVLYRELFMKGCIDEYFPEKGVLVGREVVTTNLFDLKKNYINNQNYYDESLFPYVRNCQKLIVFLENEPAEKYMLSVIGNNKFELWEEGVAHYVDLTSRWYFFLRKTAQFIMGFYTGDLFSYRMEREKITVKDRFSLRNLKQPKVSSANEYIDEVLFVSNAVVQDRLLKEGNLIKKLKSLYETTNKKIRYLPHPREPKDFLEKISIKLKELEVNIDIEIDCTSTLKYCEHKRFLLYVSPISSTLLELGSYSNSYWIPAEFGYNKVGDIINNANVFPITCLSSISELSTKINQ